jgi:hypothetical protein
MTVKKLFELNEAAQYLVGKSLDIGFECRECGCPFSVVYIESPGMLAARCDQCGKHEHSFPANASDLPQRVAEVRWDVAVEELEKRFGRWWFDMWFCAPCGH